MSPPVQHASAIAWQDEEHVFQNRKAYDEKYDAVMQLLKPVMTVDTPPAGFYLWPTLPVDDEQFTKDMFAQHNVRLVPGSYLGRTVNGENPGAQHVRMALVAPLDECVDAANRITGLLADGMKPLQPHSDRHTPPVVESRKPPIHGVFKDHFDLIVTIAGRVFAPDDISDRVIKMSL